MGTFFDITKLLTICDANKKISVSDVETVKLTICPDRELTISLFDSDEVLFTFDNDELLALQKFINFALSDKTDD